VAAFETEILDVGGARFAHPQTVDTEQYCKGGVVTVSCCSALTK
jgi:hypothetical protein